jgi:hypothetical protein
MRKRHDWVQVQRYYEAGHDAAQCRTRFGVTYSAWAMAIRRGKLEVAVSSKDRRRRHDWQAVQAYYDQGYSFYECMEQFNFCRGAWHKAVQRGEVKPRPLGQSIEELLAKGKSRRNIKVRLLRTGLLENRCCECGVNEWLGRPLSIQIDHINGIRNDNRLENLRMLCPNCHSQTETYGRRNAKRPKLQGRPRVL